MNLMLKAYDDIQATCRDFLGELTPCAHPGLHAKAQLQQRSPVTLGKKSLTFKICGQLMFTCFGLTSLYFLFKYVENHTRTQFGPSGPLFKHDFKKGTPGAQKRVENLVRCKNLNSQERLLRFGITSCFNALLLPLFPSFCSKSKQVSTPAHHLLQSCFAWHPGLKKSLRPDYFLIWFSVV